MEQEEKKIENKPNTNSLNNDYIITLNKAIIYISTTTLFGIICAVLSILTTRSIASSDGGIIYSFFVSIIIVALSIKHYNAFGIVTAIISSMLFCFALKIDIINSIVNVSTNTLQAILIFLAFRLIKLIDKNDTYQEKHVTYRNVFAIIQLIIGIIFTCIQFINKDTALALRIFTIIQLILFLSFSLIQKNKRYLIYTIVLSFLPSLISGVLNGFLQLNSPLYERGLSMEIWTLSNFILLTSFGYVFIEYINPKIAVKKLEYYDVEIKITTIIYFTTVALWNLVFLIIFYLGWLGNNLLPFVLPWLVGNMFLLANLFFNSQVEVADDKKTNAFKWYEDRAVVAEKNTQFLISIITFLLPISSSLFKKSLSIGIITIFCINITCACLSIGLIWIPNKEIKAMSLIKTLKTVFHILTVSFLLLSATMIIVPN